MAKDIFEEPNIGLVRNALLVAGHEMGETGDHWPVISSTIHSLAKDWTQAHIEKDVDAEMKTYLYRQLEIMENGLPDCAPDVRDELAPKLKELRDIYDAYFSSLDEAAVAPIRDEEIPAYIKRAEHIIATLGEEHE